MYFKPVVSLADGQTRTYEVAGVDTAALDDIARVVGTWPRGTRAAVHIGPDALGDRRFVDRVIRVADQHGFAPTRLVFAIEEWLACDDTEQTEVLLEALVAQGLRTGLDRFGSGTMSLRTLARFPIDFVKIDESAVCNPDGGHEHPGVTVASDLVGAIVAAAKVLGIDTVAAGVESLSMLAGVIALDCDYAQGSLFGGHGPVHSALRAP